MPSRAKSKRLARVEERFTVAVTDFILGLGARQGRWYDHELDTPAGLLHLSVHEGWLAARFDDVARGAAFTATCGYGCNPYSGKWNFHFGDGTPESLHPDRVLPHLRYYFDWLMACQSQAA